MDISEWDNSEIWVRFGRWSSLSEDAKFFVFLLKLQSLRSSQKRRTQNTCLKSDWTSKDSRHQRKRRRSTFSKEGNVGVSHDAATHAHNGVFSLWPLPTTLYFLPFILPLVCCSTFLPAASPHLSPLALAPSAFWIPIFLQFSSLWLFRQVPNLVLNAQPRTHPTTHFPCSWLTGGFMRPRGDPITPSWMGKRSKRGDVPGVCSSQCVPAVWQCSAMWTQAWAGTGSLTPGLMIQ